MIPWPVVHLLAIHHRWSFGMTYGWNFFLVRFTLFLVNTFMKFSALLTCALSLDRYVALHYPHRYAAITKLQASSRFYTKLIVGICFFLAFSLMIPRIKKFDISGTNCSNFDPEYSMYDKVNKHKYGQKLKSLVLEDKVLWFGNPRMPRDNQYFDYPSKRSIIDSGKTNIFLANEGGFREPVDGHPIKRRVGQLVKPTCYNFIVNKEYHSSRIYVIYKWWREIFLTWIPLILLFFLNSCIIHKYKKDIMRKKYSMIITSQGTGGPTTTDLNVSEQFGESRLNRRASKLRRKTLAFLTPRTINKDEILSDANNKLKISPSDSNFNRRRKHKSNSIVMYPTSIRRVNGLARATTPPIIAKKDKNTDKLNTFNFDERSSPTSSNKQHTSITDLCDYSEDNKILKQNTRKGSFQEPTNKESITQDTGNSTMGARRLNPIFETNTNDIKIIVPDTRPRKNVPKEDADESLNYAAVPLLSINNAKANLTSNNSPPKNLQFNHESISLTNTYDNINKRRSNSFRKFINPLIKYRPSLSLSIKSQYIRDGSLTMSEDLVEKHKRYARDECNLTLMLIITVLQHLICTGPQAIITIFDTAENRKMSYPLEIIFLVTNCLEALNYVLNFYIYCYFVKDFKASFLNMFSNRKKKRRKSCQIQLPR
ncbi:unnamed protein product [Gordionus sp. m RMFG-2023]